MAEILSLTVSEAVRVDSQRVAGIMTELGETAAQHVIGLALEQLATILTTTEAATLSKLIEGNRAPEGLFFGRLSAVSTAAVGPIVVLGWFCQKQLVQGLTFGAVK